ncbi:MAG: cell division protein FtsZ [Candidatus Zambryskibacteria bacterium CG11_big_fil_rev_8_21_14_0_20_42_18]|uniref:Cell division protein FtsZ n=1 Tax=Candidatus Zambryskibacteria bacterium CG_4_9_14_3_um_filter_42_15 TaxID=1975112 RepID=A0A2M7WSK7_9BACT|nr:MAG: cell division protein FtsZ [Candidatus Zambryskibacteria bacterium CG11_big_fil_rev_8_21_14_0_20_42_18]PJA32866.1 MAG: cell division protein FtsZ [Candidatus Zambryskibacteria bacterium CG_4_9_14_3_um_filter_42_15]
MPQVKPEVESFARIKVIGIGGSGKNTVNHMINSKVKGVDFITANTDVQDLHYSLAKKKIHIGKNLTRGLGTGMNPELGKRAIEETKEEMQEALKGADMVFIAGGMGGGTGSGAAPVIARTAKENGCLTVAVVTKPFFFEGSQRMKIADVAIEELKQAVDALIVIPNDRLLQTVEKDVTAKNAFAICDNILKEAVEGISDIITTPGVINIDFADIRSVMENAGAALMGIGSASGENRAVDAAKAAISSPLLELSINGAKGVLFSIAGGDDITMFEIQDAAKVITESVDPNAKIIFGTVRSDQLKKGEIKITVIASNFSENFSKKSASLFQGFSNDDDSSVTKGKIFNTAPQIHKDAPKSPVVTVEKKGEIKQTPPPPIEDSDDDWSAVPAFLRRSKLK